MFLQLLKSTDRELPKLLLCVSRRIRVRGDPQGSTQQQGQSAWPADAHIHPPGPPAQRVHRGGNARLRSHHRRHNGETRRSGAVSNAFWHSYKSALHYAPVILHNAHNESPVLNSLYQNISAYEQWFRHYPDTCLTNFRTSVALTFSYFMQLLHFYKLVTLRNSFPCCNIYPTRCNVTQFILSGNCSTCFGWYDHLSSGAQTTASTAFGICRYRGR